MSHLCHATGCKISVPPKMLFCLDHWRMVPRPLQQAIWDTYRPGQENDKRPSAEYVVVQKCVVLWVALMEKRVEEEQGMLDLMSTLPEKYLSRLKIGAPGSFR